jgi:hypothetical protein
MSTIADKLRQSVRDACAKYDQMRGRPGSKDAGGLVRWVEMYFESEDAAVERKVEKVAHEEKLKHDGAYRLAQQRMAAEALDAQANARKRAESRARCNQKRTEHANAYPKLRAANAELRKSLHDTLMLMGRMVGDIRYSELPAMRSQGAYAESLADQLLSHGIPDGDARVRSFVSEVALKKMDERARASANKRAA